MEAGTIVAQAIADFEHAQCVQAVLHKEKMVTPLIQGFLEIAQDTFEKSL